MIWQAEQIEKSYRHKVLSGLSLAVGNNEIVGLAGASGCGKTTLAQLAMRLERPDAGQLFFDGRNYTEYPDRKAFYRQVQMVFQHPGEAMNSRWTVRSILEEPLRNLTQETPAGRAERIDQALDAVRLPSALLGESPRNLSGGQAQRVNLARALICRPRFVILDEPTSALDAAVQRQILQLLRELQAGSGASFLLISHDLKALGEVADRIALMQDGRIVEECLPGQLDRLKKLSSGK